MKKLSVTLFGLILATLSLSAFAWTFSHYENPNGWTICYFYSTDHNGNTIWTTTHGWKLACPYPR